VLLVSRPLTSSPRLPSSPPHLQGSPLNATEEGPAWAEVLQPVMKAARSKL